MAPEFAALIVGYLDADRCKFDIIIFYKKFDIIVELYGPLERIITVASCSYGSSVPFAFSYGDKGFYVGRAAYIFCCR
jgi:hypothetical protein